jgi:hypothetical protein
MNISYVVIIEIKPFQFPVSTKCFRSVERILFPDTFTSVSLLAFLNVDGWIQRVSKK